MVVAVLVGGVVWDEDDDDCRVFVAEFILGGGTTTGDGLTKVMSNS